MIAKTKISKLSIPYKWEMIILLWFAFFLNQGDRQVFNSVLPLIRVDLGLSDIQLGLIATVFTVFYGVLVPFAGYAGDIFSRKTIVFFSLLVFSFGTLLTGFASGLIAMIVFRSIATGGGEAFYYPAANSLIGHYHSHSRAQAMAIHQTANYTGVVLGGFLAAYIGEQFGWRISFFTYGFLGLILGVIIWFRFKNPDKERVQNKSAAEKLPVSEVLNIVFKKPTVLLLSLAFGGMAFVHIGFITWMPTFLHEKFNLSLSNAAFSSMFYHHLLAYVGVLAGGKISDKLAVRFFNVRIKIEFLGLLLGAPFIFLMGTSSELLVVYAALAGFGFFRGIYDSNLFAALFDVVEPKYRASATGFMLSIAFIIASLAPVILGWAKQSVGLSIGISLLSVIYVLSALIIWIAIKWFFKIDFVKETNHQQNEN
jgi:MFS family permease